MCLSGPCFVAKFPLPPLCSTLAPRMDMRSIILASKNYFEMCSDQNADQLPSATTGSRCGHGRREVPVCRWSRRRCGAGPERRRRAGEHRSGGGIAPAHGALGKPLPQQRDQGIGHARPHPTGRAGTLGPRPERIRPYGAKLHRVGNKRLRLFTLRRCTIAQGQAQGLPLGHLLAHEHNDGHER